VTDLPVGKAVAWGSAIVVDDGYDYVYGTSSALGNEVRPRGAGSDRRPRRRLEILDRRGMVIDAASAGRLLSGVVRRMRSNGWARSTF
jgi:hypothetical protein